MSESQQFYTNCIRKAKRDYNNVEAMYWTILKEFDRLELDLYSCSQKDETIYSRLFDWAIEKVR